MSTKRGLPHVLFSNKSEPEENNGDNIVFREIDINEIADKIIDDLRRMKLDTTFRVTYAKARIGDILRFYKKTSVDEVSSTTSINTDLFEQIRSETDKTLRKSVTSMYRKVTLDANVIHLYDAALREDTKHDIRRNYIDNNLTLLKERTEEELRRIDNDAKALTLATKTAVNDYIQKYIPQETEPSAANGKPSLKRKSDFAEQDAKTKKMIEKTKYKVKENVGVLLTNPAGKKTEEEIESEEFIKEQLLDFEKKLKGDLENQKEVVDQTIQNIKNKLGQLIPIKFKAAKAEDEDENAENKETI